MPRDKNRHYHPVVRDMITDNNPGPAKPLFTIETDLGYPIVLSVYSHRLGLCTEFVWFQLWVLETGQTLSDPPFSKFIPERQEHVTQIPLTSIFGGTVFRRFDEDHLDEIAEWLDAHNGLWSARACAMPTTRPKETVPFEFSFSNLVTATEFKLRWG